MKRNISVICCLIISLIISGCGPGQLLGPTATPTLTPPTVSRIEGTVFDSYQKPIADANVILFSGGDTVAEIKTDSQGRYQFNDVKPGNYSISIVGTKEHKCFVISSLLDDINIVAGDILQKDFNLQC